MSESREIDDRTWEVIVGTGFAHPAAAGAAVSAVLLGSFLALRRLSGAPLLDAGSDAAVPLEPAVLMGAVLSVLVGYLIFGAGFAVRERGRELARIGVAVGPPTPADLANVRRSRWFGGLGAALGVVLVLSVPGVRLRFERTTPDAFWFVAVGPLFLWQLARAAYFSLYPDAELERLRAEPVDLLRLERVYMFGRLGVQGALMWFVGSSIAAVLLVEPGSAAMLLPLMGFTLTIAAVSLLLPTRGLGERIRAAKRAELSQIAERLEAARDAALRGDSTGDAGRLADLLAYRGYVDSIAESPIDASTWMRFGVYLLIPLGSWSASAIVQRIVDSLLD